MPPSPKEMLKRARKTAVDQHLRKSLASCGSPQCLCIGQDGMGLCVKSGLRTASPTSASPLLHSCRVTSGRCLRPSERTPIPSSHPLPPSTPAKASSSSSTIKASTKSWRFRPQHWLKRGRLLLQRGPATSGQESDGRKI